ncbi:MAG: protein NO VEIN domain-containing protein [Verrucomicrobiia bacterium]
MDASSDERMVVLAGVVTKQVRRLLEILAEISMRRTQFVESRFAEQGRNFPETVRFLEEIGWIRRDGNEFALTASGDVACKSVHNDNEIRQRILEAVIDVNSPFRELLADYILRFGEVNSEIGYRPPLAERLREAPLRDLLMDMRAVERRAIDDTYVLVGGGVDLYVWARGLRCHASRKGMEAATKRQEELGFAAELVVLAYEKQRVGTKWASRVEHVSSESPFASYDIKSVTLSGDTAETRYIEVKAVPGDSHQFYWTASEVELSKLLRGRYFLYLLPLVAGRGFDQAQLMVVGDPWTSVRQNSDKWLIEENVIVCRRKP